MFFRESKHPILLYSNHKQTLTALPRTELLDDSRDNKKKKIKKSWYNHTHSVT